MKMMSSDRSVEKEHQEEVVISITTKNGNVDRPESNIGEAKTTTTTTTTYDDDVSHPPQDLRNI